MNDEMLRRFLGTSAKHAIAETRLPPELAALVDSGLVLEGDCTFLQGLYSKKGSARRTDFPDSTGYEAFVNHLHLNDYFRHRIEGDGELADVLMAIEFAYRTQELDPTKLFTFIVSWNDGEWVLRFHTVRAGEEWLSPALDSYAEEAILKIQAGPRQSV